MISKRIYAAIPMIFLISSMLFLLTVPGEVNAQVLYKYIDKDGNVVVTDNPPPGIKAKPFQTSEDMADEIKPEQDKEKDLKTQKTREADAKRKEKQEKINTLRGELENAISDEQTFRRNMNQERSKIRRDQWRKLIDDKVKEIEEKKKKIVELESSP